MGFRTGDLIPGRILGIAGALPRAIHPAWPWRSGAHAGLAEAICLIRGGPQKLSLPRATEDCGQFLGGPP